MVVRTLQKGNSADELTQAILGACYTTPVNNRIEMRHKSLGALIRFVVFARSGIRISLIRGTHSKSPERAASVGGIHVGSRQHRTDAMYGADIGETLGELINGIARKRMKG